MTSRERLLAAMRFDKVDRVPVASFGLGRLDPNSSMVGELIARTDPFIEVGVPGDIYYGADCQVEWHSENHVTTAVRKTSLGNLTDRTQFTSITSARIESSVKTLEDLERYLSIDYIAPEVDASAFIARKAEIGEQGLVLVGIPTAVRSPATLLSRRYSACGGPITPM